MKFCDSIKRILQLALLVLSTGCGYRWAVCDDQRTFSIPYVVGDTDGTLTSELIHQCCRSPNISVASDGRYRLEVKIVQDSADPLGYRRDPQKIDGKIRKHLTQNEERRTILVDASIVDQQNQQTVLGPIRLGSYVDYDYVDGDSLQDLEFRTDGENQVVVLPFSLGQLEPQEAAHEAALKPLYQKLSQKIVDAISAEW